MKHVYRPRGAGYILSVATAAAIFIALAGVSVWLFFLPQTIVAAIILIISAAGLIWTVADVIFYKLVLTEEGITLSEYRVAASVKQDKVELCYDGLCEIKRTFASDEKGVNVPAIALFYSDGVFRFLNVKRFSSRQAEKFILDIKRLAELKTGRAVDIFT